MALTVRLGGEAKIPQSLAQGQRGDALDDRLPAEMILEVFYRLSLKDIAACRLVSRQFAELGASDQFLKNKICEVMNFIGKAEWERYSGEKVGKEPIVPYSVDVLKMEYKKHILVCGFDRIGEKPTTLRVFKAMVENPQGDGQATMIRIDWEKILEKYGDVPLGPSRWLLFPRYILENTSGKKYDDASQEVARYSIEKQAEHEVVHMFHAVIACALWHVHTGERLYEKLWTRCQETVGDDEGQEYRLLVGFSSSALSSALTPLF